MSQGAQVTTGDATHYVELAECIFCQCRGGGKVEKVSELPLDHTRLAWQPSPSRTAVTEWT